MKFRIVSSIGRAWPAHGVDIPLGESVHEKIPVVVMSQLLGLQDAGMLKVYEVSDNGEKSTEDEQDQTRANVTEEQILKNAAQRKSELEAKRESDRLHDEKLSGKVSQLRQPPSSESTNTDDGSKESSSSQRKAGGGQRGSGG